MRKVCLFILIFIIMVPLLQGCTSSKYRSENKLSQDTASTVQGSTELSSDNQTIQTSAQESSAISETQTEQTSVQESSVNSDTQIEQTTCDVKYKKLESIDIEIDSNKKDEKIDNIIVETENDDYLSYIGYPKSVSTAGYTENSIEIVSSAKHAVIFYPVKEGISPEEDSSKKQISYLQLPTTMSDNIRYISLSENFSGIITELAILFDDTDNEMYVLKNLNNMNDTVKDIRVVGVAKLKNNFEVKNLNVIHLFTKNRKEYILLSDNNNTLYILDVETFTLTNTMEMGDWVTLSANSYRKDAQSTEWDNIFVYQVNKERNIIRKFDILGETEIYECNINESKMQGEVLEIEPFDPTLRYVLVNNGGTYLIYLAREEGTHLIPVRIMDVNADGTPFKKIDNIFACGMEVNGQWSEFVGITIKNEKYPVKLINIYDPLWKTVK